MYRIFREPLRAGKCVRARRRGRFREQVLRVQREPGRVVRGRPAKVPGDRRRHRSRVPGVVFDVPGRGAGTPKIPTQDPADLDRSPKRTGADVEDVEMGKR